VGASEPDPGDGDTPSPPPAPDAPEAGAAAAIAPPARKKHRARIAHKVRGRIRMKIPHARGNPEILEVYRKTFLSIPGVSSITTKPDSGSIIIHYDPSRELEFERQFRRRSNQQLEMAAPVRPDDEIDRLAGKIEAEAEFLAAHSRLARTSVDFCKTLDRELKLSTDNLIDLKVVLAGGLAAFTFFQIGASAATPMWVTLALFGLNHFVELQSNHKAGLAPAQENG
jgi:hypothetical protein